MNYSIDIKKPVYGTKKMWLWISVVVIATVGIGIFNIAANKRRGWI
jgi:hypothetical protein